MAELIIKISGDAKSFQTELDKINKSTQDLNDQLSTFTKASGVAFAALTAGIGFAVSAYREAEQVNIRLQAVIKATGGVAGVTSKEVLNLASKLQSVTTFGDEAIATGSGILLTFTRIGGDVLPRASEAMLDLATKMGGDTTAAANLLGRALNDPVEGVAALTRQGVKFTDAQKDMIQSMVASGRVAEAQAFILSELEGKIGGTARAAAGGTGVFLQLKEAVGDVAEEIGANLAPAVIAAATGMKNLLVFIKEHPEITKMASALIVSGAALTGLATLAGAAALAIVKVTAVMGAFGIATTAARVAIQALWASTGIGLLVVALSSLYIYWDKVVWVAEKWAQAMTRGAGAVKQLQGPLEEFGPATLAVQAEYAEKALKANQKQIEDEARIKQQAKLAEFNKDVKDNLEKQAQRENHLQVLLAKERGASDEYLDLIKQRAEVQKALFQAQGEEELSTLLSQYNRLNTLVTEQNAVDLERKQQFNEQVLTTNQEYLDLTEEQRATFLAKNQQELQNAVETELDLKNRLANESLTRQIQADNRYLEQKKRFGETYAKLDKITHTVEYEQAKNAANDLAALAQSKNNVLKGIGKAATIANIIMATNESAMRMISGFSTIPIIGPALGYAAAGAVIAYGGTRVGEVLGLAEGGRVTGGIPGRDSVPALLSPNELVVPAQNFEDVVSAAARDMLADPESKVSAPGGIAATSQPRDVRVVIEMRGDAGRMLTARQNEDRALGVSREVG